MCVYLEWLYTRLRAKLAVCIASASTQRPTAVFCAVAQVLVYGPQGICVVAADKCYTDGVVVVVVVVAATVAL